jgi:hypothetical protein
VGRSTATALPAPEDSVALSIVMPCLDEAETVGRCVAKARAALAELGVPGEVVVADNGSRDGSRELARAAGARVVSVAERGYGHALRGGIEAARGRYVIMGDADDSYDFLAIRPFFEALRGGSSLVMGNRFAGKILPGAMPWKHRFIGNPVLTALGRIFFRSPVNDFHCGLRGFTREAYRRMDLRSAGMELASEMVVRATLLGLPISETPVVLHPDGRSRPPHLRSWRDGWRHLKFMLLFSPLWLFFLPGLLLFLLGLSGSIWLATGYRTVGAVELDVHSLLVSSAMCLIGFQAMSCAAFAKKYAVAQGLHPGTPLWRQLERTLGVEVGVALGLPMAAVGLALIGALVLEWRALGFGHLAVRETMRTAIPGTLLLALGLQIVFTSFFLGVLGQATRARAPAAIRASDRGP